MNSSLVHTHMHLRDDQEKREEPERHNKVSEYLFQCDFLFLIYIFYIYFFLLIFVNDVDWGW